MVERFRYFYDIAMGGQALAWAPILFLAFALAVFIVQAIRLSIIDIREHRLPDRIVLPLYAWVGIPLFLILLIDNDFWRARDTAYPAIFLFGCYWLFRKISRNALGFGDVKLAGVIGMICGFISPMNIFWASLIAFLLGGLVSAVLVVSKRATATSHIPFGPFMLTGAVITLFIPA